MRRNSFIDGLAMGMAAGALLGAMIAHKHRPLTPMEKTKKVVGRTARRALRTAHGTISSVTGRLSDQ